MKTSAFPLVLLLIAAGGVLRAAPPAGKYASFPPETMAVVRIDVTKLRAQPLFTEFMDAKAGGLDTLVTNIRSYVGVDLDTVTKAWVGIVKDEHVVMVFEGDFDHQAVANRVMLIDTIQVVPRDGVALCVLMPEDKKPGEFTMGAILTPKLLVVGKPELTDDYLHAFTGNREPLRPEVAAKIKTLEDEDAAAGAVVLRIPPEALRKTPWLKMFTGLRVLGDFPDDLHLRGSIGVREPGMILPMRDVLAGARDIYLQLDPEFRKLDPFLELFIQGAAVEAGETELLVNTSVNGEAVTEFVRSKMAPRAPAP